LDRAALAALLEQVGDQVQNLGRATGRLTAAVAIFAATALLAGCSPGADYPTVLDKPMPRAEETMSPDQVKQATDALINDRARLSADAQAAQAGTPATTGTTPTAGAATKP
jgi:hypothetical protein